LGKERGTMQETDIRSQLEEVRATLKANEEEHEVGRWPREIRCGEPRAGKPAGKTTLGRTDKSPDPRQRRGGECTACDERSLESSRPLPKGDALKRFDPSRVVLAVIAVARGSFSFRSYTLRAFVL
jgi:hypothetical protein